MIKKIISDRNIFLVMAVAAGILFPDLAQILKSSTFWVLAVVMTFSLSGILTKSLFPLKTVVKPMLKGILLNHIIFGVIMIPVAFLFRYDQNLFIGFIIIAATPPGVAIIPFTVKSGGNLNYSILGTFGAFIASIFLAPLIIGSFSGNPDINPFEIFKVMILLIIIPFAASRLLLIKRIIEPVKKVRGVIIDIGFSIIIYTSVGVNSHVFVSDFSTLFKVSLGVLAVMFGGSFLLKQIIKKRVSKPDIISSQLLFAVKSSGFSVVTAIQLFGDKAAVPPTILSVAVLIYLLVVIYKNK